MTKQQRNGRNSDKHRVFFSILCFSKNIHLREADTQGIRGCDNHGDPSAMPQQFDCMHYGSEEQTRTNDGSSSLQTTQAINNEQREGSDGSPAKLKNVEFYDMEYAGGE